jgi:hypothetical protein
MIDRLNAEGAALWSEKASSANGTIFRTHRLTDFVESYRLETPGFLRVTDGEWRPSAAYCHIPLRTESLQSFHLVYYPLLHIR